MGFLMGAYGKLMAGKRLRNLQYKLTTVSSRLNRATKDIERAEKMFTSMQRNVKTGLQNQMREIYANDPVYAQMMQLGQMGKYGDVTKMDSTLLNAFSTHQNEIQMQFAQASAMWENVFEMQKESMLEPLKDLEDSLQTEKDSLESQIKIAQADYDTMKEMEKAGAKDIAPDYTGQGS